MIIALLGASGSGKSTNKDEAIRNRLLAEIKYFGKEFAPQRHLFSKYLKEGEY